MRLLPFEAGESDHADDRHRTVLTLGLPDASHPQPEGDVVQDAHPGEQRERLEDHGALRSRTVDELALDGDRAAVRGLEPCDRAEERRLPTSARSEQRQELVLAHGEVDGVQRVDDVACSWHEPLRDASDLDHVHQDFLSVFHGMSLASSALTPRASSHDSSSTRKMMAKSSGPMKNPW